MTTDDDDFSMWEEEEQAEPSPQPDSFEDCFHQETDHWLTEDELYESQMAKDEANNIPPPLKAWTERDPSASVEATVAKARRLAWQQGTEETLLHKKNVEALVVPRSSSNVDKVCHFILGPGSKLQLLFADKLNVSVEECSVFLMSLLKSNRCKMSLPALHKGDEIKNLVDTTAYNAVWTKIKDLDRHAHGESFWQEVEAAPNDAHKQLFMEPQAMDSVDEVDSDFSCVIGLDDDKLHCNCTSKTKTDGLKRGHHAKDNRHGFAAHTACHSATAAPLNVSFQRQGETVRQTTRRMINDVFGKHTGASMRLDNLEIGMGRGHWDAASVFWLLWLGANLHGTLQRMEWVPLTFDHPRNDDTPFPNKPKDVKKCGCKDGFHMETTWSGKQGRPRPLVCVGHRSGAGTAVSIALSSKHRRSHWDLVPNTSADQRWCHDMPISSQDKQKKAMVLLCGTDDHQDCVECILDEMEPRTCSQGTADWFLHSLRQSFESWRQSFESLLWVLEPQRQSFESWRQSFESPLWVLEPQRKVLHSLRWSFESWRQLFESPLWVLEPQRQSFESWRQSFESLLWVLEPQRKVLHWLRQSFESWRQSFESLLWALEPQRKAFHSLWQSWRQSCESLLSVLEPQRKVLCSLRQSFESWRQPCESPLWELEPQRQSFESWRQSCESLLSVLEPQRKALCSPRHSFESWRQSCESPLWELEPQRQSFESWRQPCESLLSVLEPQRKALCSLRQSFESWRQSCESPLWELEPQRKALHSPRQSFDSWRQLFRLCSHQHC